LGELYVNRLGNTNMAMLDLARPTDSIPFGGITLPLKPSNRIRRRLAFSAQPNERKLLGRDASQRLRERDILAHTVDI